MKKLVVLIVVFCAVPLLHGQIVNENFDASASGWTGSSDSGDTYWEWGDPTGTLINDDNGGGGNAWVIGLSGDFNIQEFEAIYLTSGTYNLSSVSAGMLSLAIYRDLGTFNDGFDDLDDVVVLEYSINGVDWNPVGIPGSGTNWYNDEATGGWSLNSGGWVNASHELPMEVLGQASVQFRFLMFTNAPTGTYGKEGFAFDDFQIFSGNVETDILTMTIPGELFSANIDNSSKTVSLFVADGTDVTNLSPTFTLSTGATSSILSGAAQNFTNSVTYTITAEITSIIENWTVEVVNPTPIIRVFPASGIEGTEVSIYGRGFSTTIADNTVSFGSVNATVSAASTNKLTVTVPVGANPGINEVSVSSNGLNYFTEPKFTVVSSGSAGDFIDYKQSDFDIAISKAISLEVGDFDRDGDLDFAYDDGATLKIATIQNGKITNTVSVASGRSVTTSTLILEVSDVDKDGYPDIVAAGARLGWFKNNGNGTWADEQVIDGGSAYESILVFDADTDFDEDIFSYDGSDVVLYKNSNGESFNLSSTANSSTLAIPIDWDEDGDIDLIALGEDPMSFDQSILLLANDGSGSFTSSTLASTSLIGIESVEVGDLDNDGDNDFIYVDYDEFSGNNSIGYIINNGDGTFGTEVSISASTTPQTNKQLKLGDLNGDGFLDIARTTDDGFGNGWFYVYLSSASLTYSETELDGSIAGQDVELVDINNDGDLDILQESSASGGYFPLYVQGNSDLSITGFSFPEQIGVETIDGTAFKVNVEVNSGSDVTSLVPSITLPSDAVFVRPGSGVATDFSSGVVYTVRTVDNSSSTTQDWTVTVSQIPSDPTLSASNVGQTSVDLGWTIANNAGSNFELQISELEDFSSLVSGFDPLIINGGSNTNLTTLSAGANYYARLRASNDLGTFSGYSASVNFLTISGTPVANPATNILTESFDASWTAGSGAASYTLEVSADNFTTTVFTTNTAETSVTVNGLTAGTTYEYRVRSTNATGSSPYSNEVTVTTNVVPESLSLDSRTVNENEAIGSIVGALSTLDPNDNTHSYQLIAGNGDADNASFNIDGLNLITNEVFNFETRDQYSVRIQTTDPQGAVTASSFTIEILDVNDPPTAIVVETSNLTPKGFDPVGTKVADLFVTDEDGDDVIFALTAGGDSFEVNNTTKTLSTAVVFETEVDLVVPITLSATDPDGANISAEFNITIGAFVDVESPVLTPSPQNSATFLSGGPELTLSVTVEDFRLKDVSFFSRLLTEPEFTSELLIEDAGSYSKTILETDLGVAGIEYYFAATDEAGNEGFSQLRTMALAFPESGENAPKVESVTKFGRTVDSYQIISIPFAFNDPTKKRVDAIFNEFSGDQINREYRIIKWDPTLGEMGELSNLDPSSTIELGEGYFFISAKERSITIESANINLQDPFPLELKQGWNLVGNPYNLDLNWTSVLNNNGAGNIVGPLRVLDPDNPETWPESNILKELEGAFVFSTQDITLNLSYTDASITFGGGRMANERESAEWFLPITLEQNGDFRKGGIGMDQNAAVSLDMYDEPVLPKWLEFLEIAFIHEGERFGRLNRDVIPFAESQIWEFEVSSSSTGVAELKWDAEASQVRNLQLLDVQSGRVIDMTRESGYSFNLNGPAQFKILYSENPSDQFDFGQLEILDAYPNPVETSFRIPIQVPIRSQHQTIAVNLLDLSGRKLWSSESSLIHGGAYEFEVARPEGLAPGVYLYEVVISEGSNNRVYTKRISLK